MSDYLITESNKKQWLIKEISSHFLEKFSKAIIQFTQFSLANANTYWEENRKQQVNLSNYINNKLNSCREQRSLVIPLSCLENIAPNFKYLQYGYFKF